MPVTIRQTAPMSMSHPSRVRGLKLEVDSKNGFAALVAPFTGAWIEIEREITAFARTMRRTLHGCVD